MSFCTRSVMLRRFSMFSSILFFTGSCSRALSLETSYGSVLNREGWGVTPCVHTGRQTDKDHTYTHRHACTYSYADTHTHTQTDTHTHAHTHTHTHMHAHTHAHTHTHTHTHTRAHTRACEYTYTYKHHTYQNLNKATAMIMAPTTMITADKNKHTYIQ